MSPALRRSASAATGPCVIPEPPSAGMDRPTLSRCVRSREDRRRRKPPLETAPGNDTTYTQAHGRRHAATAPAAVRPIRRTRNSRRPLADTTRPSGGNRQEEGGG